MTVTVDRVKCACSDCVCVVEVSKGIRARGPHLLQRGLRRPPHDAGGMRARRLSLSRLSRVKAAGRSRLTNGT